MRVGGWLDISFSSYDKKHPILSQSSHLSLKSYAVLSTNDLCTLALYYYYHPLGKRIGLSVVVTWRRIVITSVFYVAVLKGRLLLPPKAIHLELISVNQ